MSERTGLTGWRTVLGRGRICPRQIKYGTKGPESHLIPEGHDKHWTSDEEMEIMKGYADYSSGWVAYKTAPGREVQWTAGYMDAYEPRLQKTIFADRFKSNIRLGAVYYLKVKMQADRRYGRISWE